MADVEKIKIQEDKLNDFVLQWSALPKEGNEAQKARLKNDIFILVYKLYKNNVDWLEEFWDILFDTLQKFNVEKGKFTHYFNKILRYRKQDQNKKEQEKQIIETSWDDTDSKEQGDGEKSNGTDTKIPLGADPDPTVTQFILENSLIELTALVLNFSERHTGRGNNETRRQWYHIFFTEDMTMAFQTCHFKYVQEHERDIFAAMHLDYLDYYMSKPCRTISQLSQTPLKTCGEVIPNYNKNDKMIPLPLPLPASVSITYFNVTDSVRSTHLGYYRKELHQL